MLVEFFRMPRKSLKFTTAEVTRAANGLKAAGYEFVYVEVKDGLFRVFPGTPPIKVIGEVNSEANEWNGAEPM
jgi:hypothetical protein